MTAEEKAFRDKIDRVELEELMYDEFYELIAEAIKIGKANGHAEAMRWRDPKEELPEYKGEYFQILLKNPNGIYFLREIFSQDNIDYLLLVEGDYCVWKPIE